MIRPSYPISSSLSTTRGPEVSSNRSISPTFSFNVPTVSGVSTKALSKDASTSTTPSLTNSTTLSSFRKNGLSGSSKYKGLPPKLPPSVSYLKPSY